MKIIMLVITGIYLVIMAVMDHRTGKIPVLPGLFCIICAAAAQILMGKGISVFLPGLLPGICLFLISKVTRGQVGAGDALVYLAAGGTLGAGRTFCLLLSSLIFASFAALFLIVIRHAGRKDTIPFVPFTAAAYGLVVCL